MTSREYFDNLYAASGDPWGLAERPYETRKYALTIAALPARSYERAFEPGCSIGVLTEALAHRCTSLIAMDGSNAAVELAGRRLRGQPHVKIRRGVVPADWPDGEFDLVVLSELLYFLDAADRKAVAERTATAIAPGGHLIAVHWRHPFTEAPTNGDVVHAELAAALRTGFRTVVRHEEPDFLLEVYERE